MEILRSLAVLGGIGLFAGAILCAAYGKLKVEEDPLVQKVSEILPGINCGACGYASCHEYAIAVAENKAKINLCRAGGAEMNEKLAEVTGSSAASSVSLKAVIFCGVKERKYAAEYGGPKDCLSASVTGGGMECRFGCFGYGDCVRACPFAALKGDVGTPRLVYERCTGCGICVQACPRDLIKLRKPRDGRIVYVGCSNTQSAKMTRKVCSNGCIACKICEKRAPEGSFIVENNLSIVRKTIPELIVENIKCPTKCIYEES